MVAGFKTYTPMALVLNYCWMINSILAFVYKNNNIPTTARRTVNVLYDKRNHVCNCVWARAIVDIQVALT